VALGDAEIDRIRVEAGHLAEKTSGDDVLHGFVFWAEDFLGIDVQGFHRTNEPFGRRVRSHFDFCKKRIIFFRET